jgi:hypothetical protein
VIHFPSFIAKHPRDQTIAVTTILTGQLDHPFHQPRFVVRNMRHSTLS